MKLDVAKIAKLANLPLTPEEKKKFSEQLEETVEYISHLDEIDTENVPPTDHVTGLENVTREDSTSVSLSQTKALENAKTTERGFFKVKAVLQDSI